ncbi:MAG TPA: penicillin-binding protein 2 [Acidimicrobiales bacterium]|nr:penicillin-binding protein 2 [Acidimicrobiales bacterium]
MTRRRSLALLVVVLAGCLALGGRLVQIQALSPEQYTELGERQLVRSLTLPAARGAIFDRNGHELALSVQQSTVWANPREVFDPSGAAVRLAPLLGVDAGVLQDRLSRDAAFVYLARTVPDAVASQVEALSLPGVYLVDEPKRFMPSGDLAAPVIGKVGTDSLALAGLELQFDDLLRGKAGRRVFERTPSGVPADGEREFVAPRRGQDLVLTLDRSLQFETERSLAAMIQGAHAKGGVAVVMESRTGEILALSNLEADPAGGPPKPAAKLTALTDVYEPGSVSKLITVAAAIEEGIVEPDDTLRIEDAIRVADHTFREHDNHGTVDWTITDVVAQSSNVGSIMLGQKVGKDRLDRYLREFGFGSKTGLGFPGESAGLMLDPDEWSGTSLPTIAIGQGIAVSAVQMLAAYNTVANRGEYVAPKLVRATVDATGEQRPSPPSPRRRVISEKTAEQMTAMLNEVVRVGTGIKAHIDGYTVAGKTGTARKPLEGARGYKPGAYMSSFAGFVPSERPALTGIVMLDEPTPIYGGLVAAPVYADVMRYALRQFRIPPPPPVAAEAVPPASETDVTTTGEPVPDASTPVPTLQNPAPAPTPTGPAAPSSPTTRTP